MNYHQIIYIIHLVFVGPLLMYSGYIGGGLSSDKKDKYLFNSLFIIGLVVSLYHGSKLAGIKFEKYK
jgi:hypothetical protein